MRKKLLLYFHFYPNFFNFFFCLCSFTYSTNRILIRRKLYCYWNRIWTFRLFIVFYNTNQKQKQSTYYNAANEKIWAVTVTGTFHMATEHLLVSLLLAPLLYIVILGPLAIKKLVNLVTLLKQVLLVSVILTDTLFNLLQEQLP